MSLTATPSLRQIQAEFGSNTRSGLALQSLRTYYTTIIGNVTSGVSRQSDFGGLASSEFSSFTASIANDNELTATFGSVVAGGIVTTLRIEIQSQFDGENQLAQPDQSEWEFLDSLTTSVDGNISRVLILDDGDWFLRGVVYNDFISHPNDWYDLGIGDFESVSVSTTSSYGQPSIISCSQSGSSSSASFNYADTPSTFEAQIKINSGSWADADLTSNTNFGTTTNPKSGTWQGDQVPAIDDTVEIRIRASAAGGVSASAWSAPCQTQ